MNTLNRYTAEYLSYCEYRKRLNFKTLKAYRIDLNQYSVFCNSSMDFLSRNTLDLYITELHKHYKPKSVKRKIASLKAFFHYLEYADLLVQNPFDKLDVHFREAKLLPKTIPFHSIQKFLSVLYAQKNQAASTYQLRCCLRDIAVIELLFATGMRISELCSLRPSDIDLENNTVLIYGKGSKERILQLGNPEVISALMLYQDSFKTDISVCGYFFVNKQKHKLSDQSVRFMINRYANLAGIEQHITPHMFRHPYVKHTTKIFSLRLMDFQAQAYPDARRKTRGACQLLRVGQSRSPVRPLCNRKRFSCLPPQSKMSWILYAISMRLSGYTSTRSISSSASSVVSVSASKIALDASLRLSCRVCSSCFCFACANTAA